MHSGGFRHEALLYAGSDQFLAGALGFVDDALVAREPVLVMTDGPKIERLRAALDGRAGAVTFADMAVVGRNPAQIIPAWQAFADENRAADRLWGIGEPVWAGRTPSELDECRHHEALLNMAFAGSGMFHLLCPYDVSTLAPETVEAAHHTHPTVVRPDGHETSAGYEGVDAAALLAEPLPPPATPTVVLELGLDDLGPVRRHAARVATAGGLDVSRAGDLALAVDEVAANSHRYAGGAGMLLSWIDEGTVVCEVRDAGRVHDPLVGRRRPGPTQVGGRGLWIANQLCDLVQLRSSAHGTVVRLHMRVDRDDAS